MEMLNKIVTVVAITCSILVGNSFTTTQLPEVCLYGAGATFPAEVYSVWMAAYKSRRMEHVKLDMKYDAKSSCYGIGQIKTSRHVEDEEHVLVHYAGSDSILVQEEYTEYPDIQMFPSMAG